MQNYHEMTKEFHYFEIQKEGFFYELRSFSKETLGASNLIIPKFQQNSESECKLFQVNLFLCVCLLRIVDKSG